MMKLSGCVATKNRAAFLRRLLPQLLEICDEVIVLVDNTTTDDSAAVAGEYTDNVFPFVFDDHYYNMEIEALNRASGDWILRVDDDETLGPQWTRPAVERLMQNRTATHFMMPTRWLIGKGERYLSNAPWYPNYGPRFYRNIRSLVRLGSSPHNVINVAGEGVRLAGLYVRHWNLVIKTRAEREAAVARYAVIDPEFSCREYYLYEDYYYETAPDIDEDEPSGILTSAAVDVLPLRIPQTIVSGDSRYVEVEIVNQTGERFDAASNFVSAGSLSLCSRWFDASGATEHERFRRQIPLPASIAPQSSMRALAQIAAPLKAGHYVVRFELLEQGVAWFSERFPGHGAHGAAVRVMAADVKTKRAIRERDSQTKNSAKSKLYKRGDISTALGASVALQQLELKEAALQTLSERAIDLAAELEEKHLALMSLHRQLRLRDELVSSKDAALMQLHKELHDLRVALERMRGKLRDKNQIALPRKAAPAKEPR